MDLVVETWSLGKNFGIMRVLDEVHLKVPRGSVFALLGPAGAGKSTLLKMLIGVQRPSAGGGLCLGFDILTRGLQIREKTGFLAQQPCFYGYMTAGELGNFCRYFYPQWENVLMKSLLDYFGIPVWMKAKDLTLEQRRRLGLALALAHRPELLILDEPAGRCGPVERNCFFSPVLEEVQSRGMTVLIASRQFEQVDGVAGEAAFLCGGRLSESCPLENLGLEEKMTVPPGGGRTG